MSVQLKEGVVSASSSSSSWNHRRLNNHIHHNNHFPLHKTSKIEESDEDLFRVPDMEAAAGGGGGGECGGGGGAVVSNGNAKPAGILSNVTVTDSQFHSGKRRRGRNPADKECRRLKRLLRNRVSAQQARERKKMYVNELEARVNQLQDKNSKLEERISTLINENTMLRKVLMNARPKVDESSEPKQDQLSKS